MQALEVFEIAVEEWILVVPFDLKCDNAHAGMGFHMIDLVRCRLARYAVDGLPHLEDMFAPTHRGKRSAQPLSEFGFAASAADDLGDRQFDRIQRGADFE